jgi:ribosome-associated protein
MEKFNLKKGGFIELHDLLKVIGLCESGGIAKTMIAQGMVQVDGVIELRKRCKVRKGQIVKFKGRQVIIQE